MIKDVLVHLDGADEDETRLAFAQHVSARFDAFLTGLYANIIPEMLIAGDPGLTAARVIVDLQTEARKTGDTAGDRLAERFAKMQVPSELRRLDVQSNIAGSMITIEARLADLFVATRPYGHAGAGLAAEILETVLFDSGRATLFVPPAGTPPPAYNTIMVAWRNSREAARAVAEAMPFLRQAESVVLALVDEGGACEQEGLEPGADIARHLVRHGVNIELRHVAGWTRAGDALLNEAEKLSAEMIVMGGYGHSRFREWILGGATRTVLRAAPMPVLVAH